jgi:predicted ATPase
MLAKPYLREIYLKRDKILNTNEYPFSIPAIAHLERISFDPNVTFFVGENGTGKSTLLEAIAVALGFNAEGGSRNFTFATRSSHSSLHAFLGLVRSHQRPRDGYFLRAESFYNVATEIELLDNEPARTALLIDSYGGRSLHEQSHGESYFALMMHRFGGEGLYILDEPEAALSIKRQIALLHRIQQLVRQNSQFIIATHSPILTAYPGATILTISASGYAISPYIETEGYKLAKAFLNDPGSFLEMP